MTETNPDSKGLEWTGERYLPSVGGGIELEHLHRYAMACERARGKVVLDIACGEGYGAAMLAEVARNVIGVDISEDAVLHASRKYRRSNLEYKLGSCAKIPLDTDSVDLIVSFETIEHHDQHEDMMKEFVRVLRPSGELVISSPDKYEYSDVPEYCNPYHIKELYRNEFKELLSDSFKNIRIYGQRIVYGSVVSIEDEPDELAVFNKDSSNKKIRSEGFRPVFNIVIASNEKVSKSESTIFERPVRESDVYQSLLAERSTVVLQRNSAVAERDAAIAERDAAFIEKDAAIAERDAVFIEKDAAIADWDRVRKDNEAILASSSWKVTVPLRFLGALLQGESGLSIRRIMSAGVSRVFNLLPLSLPAKNRLKGMIYPSLGFALKGTASYQYWLRSHDIPHPHQLNKARTVRPRKTLDLDQCLEFTFCKSPQISVVIASSNGEESLYRTLDSLLDDSGRKDYEVIVVYDSKQNANELLRSKFRGIRTVECDGGLGSLWNAGTSVAQGRYLAFLDDRVCVYPCWLDELTAACKGDVGLVGAKLIDLEGNLIEAGGAVSIDGTFIGMDPGQDPDLPRYSYLVNVDFCSVAFVVPLDKWKAIGGFADLNSYAACDLALRIYQQGGTVRCQPMARAEWEVATGSTAAEERSNFQLTWQKYLLKEQQQVQHRRKKRVLVIDMRTPTPDQDSGSVDAFNYLKIFNSFGYGVTFIPAADMQHMGKYTEDLQRIGVECLYVPYVTSVAEHLRRCRNEYDVVMLSRVTVAAQFIKLVNRYCPNAKVVFNTVDLHHLREIRQAELEGSEELKRSAAKTKELELSVIGKADCTIVISKTEENLLLNEMPSARLFHVPLIMEVCDRNLKPFEERQDIVFVGGYQHEPNVDAMCYFIAEIWPRILKQVPGTKLYIIGSNPPEKILELDSEDVDVVGYVEDLSVYLNNCRLSVAPLRFGAGVKGKVARSLAYGLPVVATPIAIEGAGLTDQENVIVADGADEFANSVFELYTNEVLWNRLSKKGIEHYERNYSLEIGERKLADLMRILGRRSFGEPGKTLELQRIKSLDEFRNHEIKNEAERRRRMEIEVRLAGDKNGFSTSGTCYVCNRNVNFFSDYKFAHKGGDGELVPNWRERLVCPSCGLNNRMRASIQVFEQLCKPQLDDSIYLTEKTTPLYDWFASHYRDVTGSEYLGGSVPCGQYDSAGIRNESLTGLTFLDAQFDYILSFDVFEHIPDYEEAFKECFRCLKSGGVLLFSVPFSLYSQSNIVRARLGRDGEIEHILPPEYHGDPLNAAGCLCFYHFGWEILGKLKGLGFASVSACLYWSDELGYLGGEQILFVAHKDMGQKT